MRLAELRGDGSRQLGERVLGLARARPSRPSQSPLSVASATRWSAVSIFDASDAGSSSELSPQPAIASASAHAASSAQSRVRAAARTVIDRTPAARRASREDAPRGSPPRAVDVVVDAPPRGGPGAQVEQHPGRARIAVARLADAARVEQPRALADVERLTVATGLAGRRLALEAVERQRDVAVPDQADPPGQAIEAQLGEQRADDVLPDGVARAPVVERDLAVVLELGPKRRQVVEVLGLDHVLRPVRGERRAAREVLERELAGDRHVVVAGDADRDAARGPSRRSRWGRRRSRRGRRGTRARARRCARRRRAPPRGRGDWRGCLRGRLLASACERRARR